MVVDGLVLLLLDVVPAAGFPVPSLETVVVEEEGSESFGVVVVSFVVLLLFSLLSFRPNVNNEDGKEVVALLVAVAVTAVVDVFVDDAPAFGTGRLRLVGLL